MTADDPFFVANPCRFCDQEMINRDDVGAGAHRECIKADQREVDALGESIGRAPLTLLMCGPSRCDHDYSDEGVSVDRGWTSVCTKCGAKAIDEAYWS